MKKSKIEWTDATWNPLRGCSKVSPGCAHCYAETMAARFSGRGQPYHGVVTKRGRWTGEVRVIEDKMEDPLRWRKPRMVFVNSMSDLFHENIATETIRRVFDIMAAAEHHTFQVLTKRARRMYYLLSRWYGHRGTDVMPGNVWIGVSVESQDYLWRVAELVHTPGAVRFVSCEPLLGRLNLTPYLGELDWVISGCESGPKARTAPMTWFEYLCDQCLDFAVPYFCKQAVVAGQFTKMPLVYNKVRDAYPKQRSQS